MLRELKIMVITVILIILLPLICEASKVGIVKEPYVSIHSRPSAYSERVTEVLMGDEIRILDERAGWVSVTIPIQRGYRGWVRSGSIIIIGKDSTFYSKEFFAHIKSPFTKARINDRSSITLYAGTRLPLIEKKDNYYTVILPDGRYGNIEKTSAVIEDNEFGSKVGPDEIIETANFLGANYKWGGMTQNGMDCSGFTYIVFRINGIFIERDSIDQASLGVQVSLNELEIGDLVFFNTRGNKISHVGIYLGNGKFIHSSSKKKGVIVSDISNEYYKKRFVKATRIVGI